MNTQADTVELRLPFKAEYVSIARLTVSGIASRVGFDLDTVEDIKVAVAEVCNKFVNTRSSISDSFSIIFKAYQNKLDIYFDCMDKSLKCIFDDETDELSVSIITALMDEVEFCTNKNFLLSMSKYTEGNI
jgi:serine/threonine-protein kinase RsbW